MTAGSLRFRVLVIGLVVAGACGFLAGCGGGGTGQVIEPEENMRRAARLYMKYMQAHNQVGPSSVDQFVTYVKGLPKKDLEEMQIVDVDKALTSPRDGQQYGFRTNFKAMDMVTMGGAANKSKMMKDPSKGGMAAQPIIVWEKAGSGGKHLVAYFMGGGVTEVDDATFQSMVPSGQ